MALQQRFPHSLENDVLLSNCCWENAVIWNKDVQVKEILLVNDLCRNIYAITIE